MGDGAVGINKKGDGNMETKMTVREQIWIEAWKAVAGTEVCSYTWGASDWADSCLKGFDEHFPQHKNQDGQKAE